MENMSSADMANSTIKRIITGSFFLLKSLHTGKVIVEFRLNIFHSTYGRHCRIKSSTCRCRATNSTHDRGLLLLFAAQNCCCAALFVVGGKSENVCVVYRYEL